MTGIGFDDDDIMAGLWGDTPSAMLDPDLPRIGGPIRFGETAAAREDEEEAIDEAPRVLPGRQKKGKKGGPVRRKPARRRATPIRARDEDDELAELAADSVTRTVLPDDVDDEEESEEPIEFETIGRVAQETRDRILGDARQIFTLPVGTLAGQTHTWSNPCYLCAYGHRGIDGLDNPLGMQLHGELMRIVSDHLYTSGAQHTTQMAAKFFFETMLPFFTESGLPVPEFNVAEVFVHLSTPLHTKNNRIFYNWAIERLATVTDALYSEVREQGRGSNVAKAREARQSLLTMRDFYKDRIEQVAFGAPTPGDIQPEVVAHMSRTELLHRQLPTMSPVALSFVLSLGVMRPNGAVAAPAVPLNGARVEEVTDPRQLDEL